MPLRALRVGITQSNMSMPCATAVDQVLRRAHAHQVARLVRGQRGAACAPGCAASPPWARPRETPPIGVAVEADLDQRRRATRRAGPRTCRPARCRTARWDCRRAPSFERSRPAQRQLASNRAASLARGRVAACTRRTPSRCRSRACAGCCIDSSGVRNSRSPLTGDGNVTPSSVILRSSPRLNTWKPPESVRIGPSQPMKRCRPPCAAITSSPGRSHRWKVLPSTICAPISLQLRAASSPSPCRRCRPA